MSPRCCSLLHICVIRKLLLRADNENISTDGDLMSSVYAKELVTEVIIKSQSEQMQVFVTCRWQNCCTVRVFVWRLNEQRTWLKYRLHVVYDLFVVSVSCSCTASCGIVQRRAVSQLINTSVGSFRWEITCYCVWNWHLLRVLLLVKRWVQSR